MNGAGDTARNRPSVWVFLLVTLGIFSAIPVDVLGNLVADEQVDDAIRTFDNRGRRLADNVVDGIVSLLVVKAEVLGVIAGTVESQGDRSPGRLQHLLEAQHGASGSFDAIYIGDATGRSIVVAPARTAAGRRLQGGIDYSDRDYFREARLTHDIAFSQVQKGRQSGVANVMIGVPYFLPDAAGSNVVSFAGIVGAGVRLDLIEELAARLVGDADGVRVLIVDGNGHTLVDSEGRVLPLADLPQETVFSGACEASARQGDDEGGRAVRTVCAPLRIGSQQWAVWVSAPVDALLADAAAARNATLHAAAASLLVAFGVSLVIVWRTRRAFAGVQDVAERVARGDFSVRLAPQGRLAPRELVELADVVGQSIERIEDSESRNQRLLTRLREVNARQAPLAAVWEQVGDAVELLDPEGRVLFVNPAHERLFDVPAERLTGRLSALFSGQEVPTDRGSLSLLDVRETLAAGRSIAASVHRRVGGQFLELGVSVSPVLDGAGQLEQIAVIRRDLTSVRMSQQAVAHSERLAAVGTMAAGLAHEINNPLTYVKSGLEELIADAEQGGSGLSAQERRDLASDALHGVGRVATIVSSLLQLSRDGEVGASATEVSVDLVQVVSSAAALAEPRLRDRAQLKVALPDHLSTRGRPSELVQVLLNLLINAGQAMPPGEVDRRFVRVTGGRSPDGRMVYVDVTDNGHGIPAEKLTRVFDPFFTTKGVGEGTGLGLSISSSIARAHGGSLDVCSSTEDGTVFRLALPFAEAATPASAPGPSSMAQRPILLVDDDVLVGRSLARMLGKDQVYVAHSVDEAVGLIDQCPDFDVILSDVKMPVRTGVDLYQHLRRHREMLSRRMVFMTGGTGEGPLMQQLAETGRPLLSKPVNRGVLQRALAPYLRG